MTLLDVCLWGMAGAGAVEVIELYKVVKTKKNFPWNLKGELSGHLFLFCVAVRLARGAFAAALCANGGRLSTAGAVAAGIAAPKVLEELGQLGVVPLGTAPVIVPPPVVIASPPSSTPDPGERSETSTSEGGPIDEA